MNIQTITLADLRPPEHNPRSVIEDAGIEELANSILADGLMTNLVVAPSRGKTCKIIAGERRFRALKLLQERGDIDETYEVAVEIRGKLSKHDKLRLATIENIQRENLSPIDEAEAFAEMARNRIRLEDIAAETGKSVGTVKRRLAIAGLCDEVKQALREERITIATAELLTLGTFEQQNQMLEQIDYHLENGWTPDFDDIRDDLLNGKPSVEDAIFPVERYKGTLTKDLFAADSETYFDDVDQFLELQEQAVAENARQLESEGHTVEVTNGYTIPSWQYRQAEDGEDGIVLINISPRGVVDIRSNVVNTDLDEETARETANPPAAPAKPKPAYSTPLCQYMAYHKSVAVQEALLRNPRSAKIVAIIGRFGHVISVHDSLKSFQDDVTPPASYQAIEQFSQAFIETLSLDSNETMPRWMDLKAAAMLEAELYDRLKDFTDEELDELLALLTAMEFGQRHCNQLDTDERSLFNHVAGDLDVKMRDHWTPDADYLNRRTKAQLTVIASEAGASQPGPFGRYGKAELVKLLAHHFDQAANAEQLTDDQKLANTWLPEAMQFPAIDPNAVIEEDEEDTAEAADSLPEAA